MDRARALAGVGHGREGFLEVGWPERGWWEVGEVRALLAQPGGMIQGVRASLLIAAGVTLAAAVTSRLLQPAAVRAHGTAGACR